MMSREVDLGDLQSKLLPWLQEKMPQAKNLSISDMERSESGFTNESFLFDLSREEAGQRRSQGMLLRCEGKTYPVYPDYKLARQFRLMERLQRTDVPAPRVYWMEEDEGLLGSSFYIMGKIDGVVPSEFPPYHSYGVCYDAPPGQRAKMWWGTLEAVARLHALDWKSLDFSFLGVPEAGTGPLDREIDYWERYLAWARESPDESHPILEAALDWLKENCYEPEHIAVCWGDARLPNVIFSPDGKVLGLLDWDMAYLGDPEADLAFILELDYLLSEGIGVPRLEGFPSEEESVKRYEELTGRRVKNLFYNQVWAGFRTGAVILKVHKNLKQIGVVMGGEDPERDNMCTQRLASLLNLPAPGLLKAEGRRIEDITVTFQVHLTGPGGGDWYLVSDRGKATRYEGVAEVPDATLTVSAEDWAAIQRGELKQFHAYTGGRLKVEGDSTLYQLLEETISRLSG